MTVTATYKNYFGSLVIEARNPELKYSEEKTKGALTKVIVALEGNQSAQATKLAKRFARLKKSSDLIAAKTKEINEKLTAQALGYFDDAADAIATRVVNTATFAISVAKDTVPEERSEVDYKKLYEAITKLIDTELQPQVTALLEAHTRKWTPEPRKPALTVKPLVKEDEAVDEGIMSAASNKLANFVAAITDGLKAFKTYISGWGKSYDMKLSELKKQLKA